MSYGGGSNSSYGSGNGILSIPTASKKMVQSLKEIVNCPEHEIYAMLKECNMDPNDTINRLITQDHFHEVKSKREKKKEMKESTESRSRGVSSTSNRGRGGADRDVGRSSSAQFSSSDSGVTRGKPAYKKDYGPSAIPNSSYAYGMSTNNINCRPTSLSDPISIENTVPTVGTSDGISLSSKSSSGFQTAWLGTPGHVSMADIVKMGRPHAKTSAIPTTATATSHSPHSAIMSNMSQQSAKHHLFSMPMPSASHHDIRSYQDPASKVSEMTQEPSCAVNQDLFHDDWPIVEQSPAESGPAVGEPSSACVIYADPSPSSSHVDRVSLHPTSELDEIQVTEGTLTVENQIVDSIGSAAASDRQIQVDNSGGASHFDDNSFKSRSSYQSQSPAFEHQEGIGGSSHLPIPDYPVPSSVEDVSEAVSSTAAGLQHMSLHNEEISGPPAGENPAVIIPNHLQVTTADCSHLSFGSFGSGISATFSGSFASKNLKSNSGEASAEADGSSLEHLDTRNPEYYGNEQHRSITIENVESPSSSQPEVVKHDGAVEATHGHQYPFPSSVPSYAIENSAQMNAAGYTYAHSNSQMQNLASFSSVMQASTNSLPINLLSSTVQPVRESDLPYSQFIATQSMPTKYSSGMSSISGPTISVPEAMKTNIFTTPQPTPQTLPSTSIPTGPALPPHLAVHHYSQPTLFTNMITYPLLPQSYAYMPSAFQQSYAANSVYHQSPAPVQSAGMKYSLQYKNSISSLPQPTSIASGYAGFGSSANIPGSVLLNPSTTSPSTTIGYEDIIGSQYKDSNHYGSPQQSEASTMWVNGPGSRTMSAHQASTYYGFQGQNQLGGIRQSQQPSHYGALGYPNFYHSQLGISQEHQQTPNDGTLSASQGPPSQQSHQIWQHSY